MKTQINTLVSGDFRKSISGTNRKIREEIAKQVISENHENMKISIRGIEIDLTANWSLSRKSVTYFGSIPIDLYKQFCGMIGVPKKEPKCTVQVNGDMSVWFTTNNNKKMWQIIQESEITIL